jgi:hypothetical protein
MDRLRIPRIRSALKAVAASARLDLSSGEKSKRLNNPEILETTKRWLTCRRKFTPQRRCLDAVLCHHRCRRLLVACAALSFVDPNEHNKCGRK